MWNISKTANYKNGWEWMNLKYTYLERQRKREREREREREHMCCLFSQFINNINKLPWYIS